MSVPDGWCEGGATVTPGLTASACWEGAGALGLMRATRYPRVFHDAHHRCLFAGFIVRINNTTPGLCKWIRCCLHYKDCNSNSICCGFRQMSFFKRNRHSESVVLFLLFNISVDVIQTRFPMFVNGSCFQKYDLENLGPCTTTVENTKSHYTKHSNDVIAKCPFRNEAPSCQGCLVHCLPLFYYVVCCHHCCTEG